jgi:ribosome-binding factor A
MPSQRKQRVAHLLRAEISTILLRKLKDPRVRMTTISEVDVAPDLKTARVHVSIFGEKELREDALLGLRSASGFIRGELMKALNLRPMPFLTFELDTALERGAHTLDLLDQVLHEQPPNEPGAASGGDADPEQ